MNGSEGGVARHVAIITDGNGRWAQQRGLSVAEGHQAGADTVKDRLRDAAELGVRELTVYSFSTENWNRPAAEVELQKLTDGQIQQLDGLLKKKEEEILEV